LGGGCDADDALLPEKLSLLLGEMLAEQELLVEEGRSSRSG
jgi:hypothetical protein